MPAGPNQLTEQAKFTYFLLGKAFEKETKTVEEDREKQTKAIKNRRKNVSKLQNFHDFLGSSYHQQNTFFR